MRRTRSTLKTAGAKDTVNEKQTDRQTERAPSHAPALTYGLVRICSTIHAMLSMSLLLSDSLTPAGALKGDPISDKAVAAIHAEIALAMATTAWGQVLLVHGCGPTEPKQRTTPSCYGGDCFSEFNFTLAEVRARECMGERPHPQRDHTLGVMIFRHYSTIISSLATIYPVTIYPPRETS